MPTKPAVKASRVSWKKEYANANADMARQSNLSLGRAFTVQDKPQRSCLGRAHVHASREVLTSDLDWNWNVLLKRWNSRGRKQFMIWYDTEHGDIIVAIRFLQLIRHSK